MTVINARFLTHKITGAQRYAIEISRHLQKLLDDLVFIAPFSKFSYSKENFKVHSTGIFQGHLWEQLDLPLYLFKEKNPLLINLTNTAPAFYKNQIITIHDLGFLNKNWVTPQFKFFYESLMPQIVKNSLKIVTVSNFSKEEIIKHFKVSADKIEVIYNAVSQDFFELAKDDTNSPSMQYRPDSDNGVGCRDGANQYDFQNNYGEYILAVSSLNPRKNFANLLQAFNNLKLKDTKLLIAGSKASIYKNFDIKNLIKDDSRVVFTGYVADSELAGLYKNAKLFVFPSFYEGFGIPPLEAMACGCPTVVSNVSSIPEVCADAAYYVNPNDVRSIEAGIYKVLNNLSLQQELKSKGLERVKKFSWENSAQKYARIIKDLL